ncbi:hypothetical protein CXF96_08300 [Stenotrophomonas sp. Betaine-02u-21]|nr:hypothetical protein CXF90_15115 [Stenotrophomonas sp. Betaine-02u-23]PKH74309.1 hypothetical protein CXF96_08300 [Stenotrophomonas sp. Betaine-02u-21]PKH96360.1 hypothetical protein CXG43_07255 [Stenotrophomonas sp. Bg11-02]
MNGFVVVTKESSVCRFDRLLELRSKMGWVYGSEDLCVLLYSLVKRTRPRVMVELGTGFGVTTAWVAAAMKETGVGTLYTYDNASHFKSEAGRRFASGLDGALANLLNRDDGPSSYLDFVAALLVWAGVDGPVAQVEGDIDLKKIAAAPYLDPGVDCVFSDFSHSPESIQSLLGAFLGRLRPTASIFIDSASTQRLSYLTLERIVDDLNQNKLPIGILAGCTEAEVSALVRKVQCSRFRLMHLIEDRQRAQNSTAWLSVEPVDVVPTSAAFLH